MGEGKSWVDLTYNTMDKFHGWINTMGGRIPRANATYDTIGKSHG